MRVVTNVNSTQGWPSRVSHSCHGRRSAPGHARRPASQDKKNLGLMMMLYPCTAIALLWTKCNRAIQ